MEPGKAKTASALLVDLIGPLVACRQGKGLRPPPTYWTKHQCVHASPPFPHVCWVSEQWHIPASLGGCPLLASMGVVTKEDKMFPVAYVSFKAPAPIFPWMTLGLAEGHGKEPLSCIWSSSLLSAWKLEEVVLPGQTTQRARPSTPKLWFLFTNWISSVCLFPFLDLQSMAKIHKASSWGAQSIFRKD